MIPKTIHFCWFSGEEMPSLVMDCISTWKEHLPDYHLRLWDEYSFDFDSVQFVKEAYAAKKWAFVTDYVRFHALHSEGGLYLDSDVRVLKTFREEWLSHRFFSAHEVQPSLFTPSSLGKDFLPSPNEISYEGINIQGAIMASEKGHPFLKECMEWYEKENFLDETGKMREVTEIIIGRVLAEVSARYGYVPQHIEQHLKDDILILPSDILAGNSLHLNDHSYAIHLVNGSWHERSGIEKFLYDANNWHPSLAPYIAFVQKSIRKIRRWVK